MYQFHQSPVAVTLGRGHNPRGLQNCPFGSRRRRPTQQEACRAARGSQRKGAAEGLIVRFAAFLTWRRNKSDRWGKKVPPVRGTSEARSRRPGPKRPIGAFERPANGGWDRGGCRVTLFAARTVISVRSQGSEGVVMTSRFGSVVLGVGDLERSKRSSSRRGLRALALGLILMVGVGPALADLAAQQSTPPFPSRTGARAPLVTPAMVIGSAWQTENRPLQNARVWLRNVLQGTVQAQGTTNASGEFRFSGLGAGTYVVEVIDKTGRVLAVGQTFAVEPGQTVATLVRLPAPGRETREAKRDPQPRRPVEAAPVPPPPPAMTAAVPPPIPPAPPAPPMMAAASPPPAPPAPPMTAVAPPPPPPPPPPPASSPRAVPQAPPAPPMAAVAPPPPPPPPASAPRAVPPAPPAPPARPPMTVVASPPPPAQPVAPTPERPRVRTESPEGKSNRNKILAVLAGAGVVMAALLASNSRN